MAPDEESDMSRPGGKLPACQPSLPWRITSSLTMGATAAASRAFLYTLNSVEVTGLQRFLDILDKRKDTERRERGLITGKGYFRLMRRVLMHV
jgi:monolysocardiolipin acyltransferase